jgi:hypothetical protein
MHDMYNAVIWLDGKSSLYETIRETGRLGIIDKVLKTADADIRVKFNADEIKNRQAYYDLPAYISCFDMT